MSASTVARMGDNEIHLHVVSPRNLQNSTQPFREPSDLKHSSPAFPPTSGARIKIALAQSRRAAEQSCEDETRRTNGMRKSKDKEKGKHDRTGVPSASSEGVACRWIPHLLLDGAPRQRQESSTPGQQLTRSNRTNNHEQNQ